MYVCMYVCMYVVRDTSQPENRICLPEVRIIGLLYVILIYVYIYTYIMKNYICMYINV